MRRFLRDNSLSVVFGALFVVALVGQAVAGRARLNHEQVTAHLPTYGMARYLTSSDFFVTTLENWQSEFLQFFLYILLTAFLVQRGSADSKEPGEEGTESDEQQGTGAFAQAGSPRGASAHGLAGAVYAHSLCLAFGLLFLLSWAAQAVTGWVTSNQELARDDLPAQGFVAYLGSPDFWSRSLQNWQSEFLAVGTMAVLTIWLRQRGSAESKPVGAAHASTGSDV